MRAILGAAGEARFAGRRVEWLPVAWDEASKPRLRRTTDAGTDVAVDLPRGSYLADGAVLDDDGERVVAVRRTPEPALVVRFDAGLPPERLVAQALALGLAFGNQHVPVEVDGVHARIPLTTSERVARDTVGALGLEGVSVEVATVALGRERPPASGHAHGAGAHGGDGHGHAHAPGDP